MPTYSLAATPGRVLIQRRLAPERVGTIVIPDRHREEHTPLEGDIRSVGMGVDHFATGDHVVFKEHAGVEIDIGDNVRYISLNPDDIVAFITKEDEPNGQE